MKCPNCGAELAPALRDGLEVEVCKSCGGMWLTAQDLEDLEDEAFKLGDDEKGSLVFRSDESRRRCPQCDAAMRTFQYRLYDLDLELCPAGHGYWLDAGEDKRVLTLMREEQARLKSTHSAEQHWATHLKHWRNRPLIRRLLGL